MIDGIGKRLGVQCLTIGYSTEIGKRDNAVGKHRAIDYRHLKLQAFIQMIIIPGLHHTAPESHSYRHGGNG